MQRLVEKARPPATKSDSEIGLWLLISIILAFALLYANDADVSSAAMQAPRAWLNKVRGRQGSSVQIFEVLHGELCMVEALVALVGTHFTTDC